MDARFLSIVALSAAVAATGVTIASCSSVSNRQFGIDAPAFSRSSFSPLGDYLVARCGTLDCHGQSSRNFRVYGCDGLRLDAGNTVTCGVGNLTTDDEYQATYRSLIGLEPQVMNTVFAGCNGAMSPEGGAAYPAPQSCHPEYLTFVAKARGLEAHKGGQLICLSPPCPPGVPDPDPYDPQDVCIVTWLEGQVNAMACGSALSIGFPVADASTE